MTSAAASTPQPSPSNWTLFDFEQQKGVATELNTPLNLWLTSTCSLFNENWRSLTSDKTTLAYQASRSESFVQFKKGCAERCWGIHSHLGQSRLETAFVMDRHLVVAIAASLLDEEIEVADDSDSLDVTVIEDELVRMFAESIFYSLAEAWIGLDALDFQITESSPFPRRSPLFVPHCSLVTIEFEVVLGESDYRFHWLLPEKEFEQLMSSVDSTSQNPFKVSSFESDLQQLASGFEVGLHVQLGSTLLNVSQLERLQVGDVITMNQSVESPLKVSVGGVEKFEAIPGKTKETQTIRIVRGLSTLSERSK